MSPTQDSYTNGIDIISIIDKHRSGYLVKDAKNRTLILSSLKGYRRIDDTRSIKDWYKDSNSYIRKHPFSALITSLGVFLGLTSF